MSEINPGTSLAFINASNTTTINLPLVASNISRVIQMKTIGEGSNGSILVANISESPPDKLQPNIELFSNTFHLPNATLQAATSNRWNWNQFYFETGFHFDSNVVPTGTSIPLTPNKTFWAVDLRTEAKTLVLPPTTQANANSNQSCLFIIKDKYGYAETNPLFVEVTAPDIFETPEYGTAIRLKENFACIQLVANSGTNTWNVLSYYNGNQT